jgi:hypothetical protein
MSREYLIEILEIVNKEPEKLVEFKGNNALKSLFEHAFLPEKKFELPEGVPPYKEDAGPIGMSPSNFTQEMRKLYIYTKEQPLNQIRRETLFIQLLESVHPSEAKVLCAIKDQTLHKMYKNITADLVSEHGFIPKVVKEKKNGKPG